MNQRILITGSNGLLGQKLMSQLLSEGKSEFLATSSGANRVHGLGDFNYQSLDITNALEVVKVFDDYRPSLVINTAAMTNVDLCESDKEGCMRLNVDAVDYIIRACAKHGSKLVHLSTDFIFDGQNGPYSEEDYAVPLSFYGKSKLAGETLVVSSTIDWAIVRTVLVYGVTENMSRSNIVLWAKNALEKGDAIKVVNDQFRTPTLAEDLAAGCLLIADKNATGIFNISGKDFMGVDEMVKRIATFFKMECNNMTTVSSDTLNQAAKRPPITGFKLDKAINMIGYAPHSFEEGLAIVAQQLQQQ